MEFSKYQRAIFEFVRNDEGSALINAVAGSGKTTTGVEATKLIPEGKRQLFVAFNKSIATELERRVSRNVKVYTYHALGFSAYRSQHQDVQVDGNKLSRLMREKLALTVAEAKLYGAFVLRLTSLAKMNGMGYLVPDVFRSWLDMIDEHDFQLESEEASVERGIELSQRLLGLSNAERNVIDFTDMEYLPLIDNLRFFPNDVIFVDEAQDTSATERVLLERALKKDGRLFAFGDRRQSLYHFRGASSDAMDRIKDHFNCVELPLSISYRCPKAVVREAQRIAPEIESAADAPEGVVEVLAKYDAQAFGPTDAILCRNAAPLVETAYWLLKNKVPCRMLGSEIGKGLVTLIKKMNAPDIDALTQRLTIYLSREVTKYMEKGETAKAERVKDKVNCVEVMIENLPETDRTVEFLISDIEGLFADTVEGRLTLSTVHKFKGSERKTIFILDKSKYMPSKWARKAVAKQQESNIIYVALTRAQERLVFITTEGRKVA